jgi:hypothetical protein
MSVPVAAEARQVMRPSWSSRSAAILILVSLGCGGGERTVIGPPPPTGSDVVLNLVPDPEDAAIAQALGWTSGIPEAEVRRPDGTVFLSSVTGTVTIAGFKSGDLRVSIRRMLTESELAAVAGSGAVAFVRDLELAVQPGTSTATVSVPVSYRRSLVISEFSYRPRFIPGVGTYTYGGFIELYNNSDSTLFLDGVLLGAMWPQAFETATSVTKCADMAPFYEDPAGVWVTFMAAFPGSGQSYPVAPGQVIVVATDAIDHRDLFPGQLDLRDADFEFIGFADVDNPAVPNMVDLSLRQPPLAEHGLYWHAVSTAMAPALARADPAALVRAPGPPPNRHEHARLPKEQLLDIFLTSTTWFAEQQPPYTECPRLVHPSIDRRHGYFLREGENEYAVSQSRKVLTTRPDGRHVLQHTRSSADDFRRGSRSPGRIVP